MRPPHWGCVGGGAGQWRGGEGRVKSERIPKEFPGVPRGVPLGPLRVSRAPRVVFLALLATTEGSADWAKRVRLSTTVMPDCSRGHAPFQGAAVTEYGHEADEIGKQEKDWLAAALRCLTQEESTELGVIRKAPQTYRLATQWWLIMLDTFLFALPSTTSVQGNQVWGHREEGNSEGGETKDVWEVEGAGVVAPSRISSVAGTLHAWAPP